MSTKVSRIRVTTNRVLGVAAAIAMGAAAVLATTAPASGSPNVPPLPGAGKALTVAALPHNKIPAGARRATHGLPARGKHGAAFQPATAPHRSGSSPRVVNGTLANASDFPYVVGIESLFLALGDDGKPAWFELWCTGTVLSPTKVLTAGHCEADLPFGSTVVIAGRNDLDTETDGFVAGVSSSWIDQSFNWAGLVAGTASVPVDDVSVLTLSTALPSAYTPVTLGAQNDQSPYAAGTNATIVGYGITQSSASDPGVLRTGTVPIQSDATCSATLSGYDSSRMTCAGNPPNGADTCGGDSGGPLMVNNVEVGITDWGMEPCGSSYGVYERLSKYSDTVKADVTRAPLVNLDFSGDGHSDLLARNSSGTLTEYSGSGFGPDGFGGFDGTTSLGVGWQVYSKLFRVTNWNGDGRASVMAETSTGNLYQYQTDGVGDFVGGRSQIGTAWNIFSDIMVVNNWLNDGHPNLMGRKPNGDLYLYTSDGHGGWLNGGIGVKIGTGWNMFNTILTPGTWTGDGHQALIGRTPAGDLFLYESDGHGGWLNGGVGLKIGTGWNMFRTFMSPGDWNGDDMVDILGVTPGGVMFLYTTDGRGNWQTGIGQQIGTGWNTFNAIF